jgi:Holliday junction resolvasome RuvABC ATP-dependent DNA helicase subunit
MKFIGQRAIEPELTVLLNKIKSGENVNILLRAPSGYGKTDLALRLVNINDPKGFDYLIPLSGEIYINPYKRLHIIDEVHLLKDPEIIYPILDSGKHTFILCTNECGILKEPLINRCIQFVFQDYSVDEMQEFVDLFYREYYRVIPGSYINIIAQNSQNNPRICKQICQRLINVFNIYGFPESEDQLNHYIRNILNIHDGLSILQEQYLTVLRNFGTARLDIIASYLHIDKATIQRDIEPYLLYNNKIRISSRGRTIL